MATSISVPIANSVPKTSFNFNNKSKPFPIHQFNFCKSHSFGVKNGFVSVKWRIGAGLSEIEPDLNEDPVNPFGLNSIDPEDFEYGKYDGHHTYFEGEDDKRTFWEAIADDLKAVETPTGFQGLISWLFLPAVAAGMYFDVPGEYLYIGAGLFTIVFCIIEMDKPDKPHNFEPRIYNMERGARDKLINDYNTMSIWDFNEKYGDLWDFTIEKDDNDIMKR